MLKNTDETCLKLNYRMLIQLVPELWLLKQGKALKSHLEGYMDLNLDVLEKQEDEMTIALSHYYSENDDMIPDPDMQLHICRSSKLVRALTYQDRFRYDEIDVDDHLDSLYLERSLNHFLKGWLINCLSEGHHLTRTPKNKRDS